MQHKQIITHEIWSNVFKLIWVNSEFFLAQNPFEVKSLSALKKNIPNTLSEALDQKNLPDQFNQLTKILNTDVGLVVYLANCLSAYPEIWGELDNWYEVNKSYLVQYRKQKTTNLDRIRLHIQDKEEQKMREKMDIILQFLWINSEFFKSPYQTEVLDPMHPLNPLLKVLTFGLCQQAFIDFQAALGFLAKNNSMVMRKILSNNLKFVEVLFNSLSINSNYLETHLQKWYSDNKISKNREERISELHQITQQKREALQKFHEQTIIETKQRNDKIRQEAKERQAKVKQDFLKQALRFLTANIEFFHASIEPGDSPFTWWVAKDEDREEIIQEFSEKISDELEEEPATKIYKTRSYINAMQNLLTDPDLMHEFLSINVPILTIIYHFEVEHPIQAHINVWYEEHPAEKSKKTRREMSVGNITENNNKRSFYESKLNVFAHDKKRQKTESSQVPKFNM